MLFELIFLIVIIVVIVRVINKTRTATSGLFGDLARGGGLLGGGRELEGLFQGLEQQIRNYQSLPPEQRRLQDAQMAAMWLQMNTQMRSIDANQRGMYEARVGDIAGEAARNGIDFTPPSW